MSRRFSEDSSNSLRFALYAVWKPQAHFEMIVNTTRNELLPMVVATQDTVVGSWFPQMDNEIETKCGVKLQRNFSPVPHSDEI